MAGLVIDRFVTRLDLVEHRLIDVSVPGRDHVLRGALEDGEMFGFGSDNGDRLHPAGTSADNSDLLASEVDSFVWPCTGVIRLTRKGVSTDEVRNLT